MGKERPCAHLMHVQRTPMNHLIVHEGGECSERAHHAASGVSCFGGWAECIGRYRVLDRGNGVGMMAR